VRFLVYISLCSILFLATSCSKKVKDKVVKAPPKQVESAKEEVEIDMTVDTTSITTIPVKEVKFIVLEMQTERCYGGGCPEYKFSLHSDGIAFYTCTSSCKAIRGNFHAFIGREKAEEVLAHINEHDMLNMNSVYPENGKPVEHIPAIQFNLAISDRRKKTIRSYHHTPASLLTLQRIVEELVAEVDWERSLE